jgi:hypothetical protein
MADKKSKALAMELIDDLLNDKTEEVKATAQEPEKPASKPAPDKSAKADHHDDRTERINESKLQQALAKPSHPKGEGGEDKVRASVGRFSSMRAGAAGGTEAALAQSESLRIAQGRILELEGEIERLRTQNEELGAAAETLRRRSDELLAINNRREADYQNAISSFEQEKGILTGARETMGRDVEQLRRKNEELELRISSNIQKIRVRERELENRLELIKMEGQALIRSKDDMILELKRQIDQLSLELNNYRTKNQELNRQTSDKQEMLRRTVKALRLALSMLEGEEEQKNNPSNPQRKTK